MSSTFVSNIQNYSIHDGPGIRTVVFLKGCPLRCRWCANPENLTPGTVLGFLSRLCQNCGRCLRACGHGAIVPGEGVYRIDREKCVSCMKCAELCFAGALTVYGREMTDEETFRKAARDKIFYDESGGGVTVSGGEPLTHPEFVSDLFGRCREAGISTCAETCGCVPWESFEAVKEKTDLFLFDMKFADSELHREYTGVGNERILENARKLASAGAEILFRRPLIPGVNDGREETERTAAFIRSLGRDIGLELMPYHRMGAAKYEALRMEYAMGDLPPLPPAEAEKTAEVYRQLGVDCRVSK